MPATADCLAAHFLLGYSVCDSDFVGQTVLLQELSEKVENSTGLTIVLAGPRGVG